MIIFGRVKGMNIFSSIYPHNATIETEYQIRLLSTVRQKPGLFLKKNKVPCVSDFKPDRNGSNPEENGLYEAGAFRIFIRFLPDLTRFHPGKINHRKLVQRAGNSK